MGVSFKTLRESTITQQRLALNRSHTYTPTQAEIQPSMCERLHLLLLRHEGDGLKNEEEISKLAEKK